jgi:hypothetical protein
MKKLIYAFLSLVSLASLLVAVPVLADNTSAGQSDNGVGNGMMYGRGNFKGMMKPGIFGTVSAVSGNTITVAGKQGFGATATTVTYTVDATNAKITKNNATGTIASIVVGDMVAVQGTLNGTNVVATVVRDGAMRPGLGFGRTENGNNPAQLPAIVGNGQPVVLGTVSTINGSTVTITNKSNVTYTVDATNAKIVQGPNTITVSGVKVGDTIIVQGTVNGTNITASNIIDQTKPASTTTPATGGSHMGFFAGIGSFFARLFGF